MGNYQQKSSKTVTDEKLKFGSYNNPSNPRPGYYKIAGNVFYRGQQMNGTDYNSFVKLGSSWAKDKSSVYYKGKTIPEANVKTFTVNGCIGTDNKHKFKNGKIIQ